MCLIIDANFVHKVHPDSDVDGKPLIEAMFAGQARLVYGGRITQEYAPRFRSWIRILDGAGRAHKEDDKEVEKATEILVNAGTCSSDDEHIIALAQVSGARLLCSCDQDLHTDFRDPQLISKPRGNVYQTARHRDLIRKHCSDS